MGKSQTPDWMKLFGLLAGLAVHGLGLTWYLGSWTSAVQGKIDMVGQSVSFTNSSVAELKADVRRLSEMGIQLEKTTSAMDALEKRIDRLETSQSTFTRTSK